MAGLSILQDKSKYLAWIKAEFQPRILATPDSTIEQIIDNAVRYWNTHSAYKISQMVDWGGGTRVQLAADFKSVVAVYPNRNANWIWNEYPTWSLAGIAVLDNIRTDMILATESFRSLHIYAGANFRWWFDENHDDPSEGGYLYLRNTPTGVSGLLVVGTKRILPADDIDSQHINDWILYYSKALVKQVEGHALRAANIVLPGDLDGDQMMREGKEEAEQLKKDLGVNGRWVAFIRRQ